MDLSGLTTLSTLQAGIEYALAGLSNLEGNRLLQATSPVSKEDQARTKDLAAE